MCGIFFAYNYLLNNQDINRVQSLLNNRGPDSHGVWESGQLTMIHTRLSIIDLSIAGNQPMLNISRDCCLIFYGEIYNYLELKKETSDYPYKGSSDTEVILACYEKWG